MSEQIQETQPGDTTLEDIKLDEIPEEQDTEGADIMAQFARLLGYNSAPPVNLRKAEPFQDVQFKAFVPGETEPFVGFESFLGTELEAKLNEVAERKLNLLFVYECPQHLKDPAKCEKAWHEYCLTLNGDEFVHWFLATKMGTGNGHWIDDRKMEEDGIGINSPVREGGESASAEESTPATV